MTTRQRGRSAAGAPRPAGAPAATVRAGARGRAAAAPSRLCRSSGISCRAPSPAPSTHAVEHARIGEPREARAARSPALIASITASAKPRRAPSGAWWARRQAVTNTNSTPRPRVSTRPLPSASIRLPANGSTHHADACGDADRRGAHSATMAAASAANAATTNARRRVSTAERRGPGHVTGRPCAPGPFCAVEVVAGADGRGGTGPRWPGSPACAPGRSGPRCRPAAAAS